MDPSTSGVSLGSTSSAPRLSSSCASEDAPKMAVLTLVLAIVHASCTRMCSAGQRRQQLRMLLCVHTRGTDHRRRHHHII
jgi:hypothetical protein